MSSALLVFLSATVILCQCQDYTNNGQWVSRNDDSTQQQNRTSLAQSVSEMYFANGNCVYSNGLLNDSGEMRNLTETEKQQLRQYFQDMDRYTLNLNKNLFQILRDFFSFGTQTDNNKAQSSPQNDQDMANYNQNNGDAPSSQFPIAPCFCKSC